MHLSYLRCVCKISPPAPLQFFAVLSSVKFKVKDLTSSIDVLQIYASAKEDKIKTIENIFPVMKQ